mmetsp:Transcript_57357/g.124676  ORF Transcript_57357/g.124676 Transcript_57357/m.124676 type:complete len:112 (+) Transcript_57357:3-338(+)
MDPACKSLASRYLPRRFTSRSFGAVASLTSIGALLGHNLGSWLYAQEKQGCAPFLVASVALCGSAVTTALARCASNTPLDAKAHQSPTPTPRRDDPEGIALLDKAANLEDG